MSLSQEYFNSKVLELLNTKLSNGIQMQTENEIDFHLPVASLDEFDLFENNLRSDAAFKHNLVSITIK